MPDERPLLLILGASTRAAAHSARRAGFRAICADLFADLDLFEAAEVLPKRIVKYPDDLVCAAALAPPCPWMYTGAIENYPDVVTRISAERPLWGNSAEVIARVRDPAFVLAALTNAGLPAPSIHPASDPPLADGTWMLKPFRSGGGRGLRIWNETARHCRTLKEPHWFQQRVAGPSLSAVYVGCARSAALVGVTRQWVGEREFHGPPHGYCGSIGPVDLSPAEREQIARLGSALANAADLHGLFGVDFILNEQGPWAVDINPRYTASVELLEHAFDVPLVDWHARACRPGSDCSACHELEQSLPMRPARFGAKGVLFARREVVVPRLADVIPSTGDFSKDFPAIADRPAPGTVIAEGAPVCSVFAWGSSERECRERLADRVRQVHSALSQNPGALSQNPGPNFHGSS